MTADTRHDGRAPEELRPVTIELGFARQSDGSALYRCGGTTLLITANLSESVPPWLEGRGRGWLTAEYAMMPGSTSPRKDRRPDGRSTEIQRLIGRGLRAAFDLEALGPRTVRVDADVIEADGGTRTAAITGAFVAAVQALASKLEPEHVQTVLRTSVAAVSVGIVGGRALLDLDYREDSTAEVDCNVVRLGDGGLVEVQGAGEAGAFSRGQLTELLDLAEIGLDRLSALQRETLELGKP